MEKATEAIASPASGLRRTGTLMIFGAVRCSTIGSAGTASTAATGEFSQGAKSTKVLTWAPLPLPTVDGPLAAPHQLFSPLAVR